jgi:hypothetical protein
LSVAATIFPKTDGVSFNKKLLFPNTETQKKLRNVKKKLTWEERFKKSLK